MENKTETEVKDTLEAICSLLPVAAYKDDCDVIIKRYLSKIIENSVNAVSPKQFCTNLKICPAKSIEIVEHKDSCEVCDYISEQLENYVIKDKTEEEIKETLEAICSLLPISSYKNDCDVIIERYLTKIVENSVNVVSPKQFCTNLKICPTKRIEEVKSKDRCEICELISEKLEDYVVQNKTEE